MAVKRECRAEREAGEGETKRSIFFGATCRERAIRQVKKLRRPWLEAAVCYGGGVVWHHQNMMCSESHVCEVTAERSRDSDA